MSSSAFTDAYLAALSAMEGKRRPVPLHDTARFMGADEGVMATDDTLRAHLETVDREDPLRKRLHQALLTWDAVDKAAWTEDTERQSEERRALVLQLLKVDKEMAAFLSDKFRVVARDEVLIADDDDWQPWYTPEIRASRDFYWSSYKTLLTGKGWDADAVTALDRTTDQVIERLSDPSRPEAFQAKGLVVGHVQSGKTANFTGVVAKAIDAGYRLIIVLTGTTDMLRSQTQRRLDMELIGVENILGGIDPDDADLLDEVDYQDDPDWIEGKFLSHGVQPNDMDRPAIHRLTTYAGDYKSLKQGIEALNFPKADRRKRFFELENLLPADTKVAIVKKNGTVLRKLASDLHRIKKKTNLGEIPTLIVDDESDQASVNTSNPKNWTNGEVERTAINGLISDLLDALPRAQYVGYSATPFANVFIDPSDTEDIFPKDFILSLDPPPGYTGAAAFHDLESDLDEADRTYANSNRNSFIRFVREPSGEDDETLRKAIDTFVLTGAIKLYRQEHGARTFRHHTMLVHETMRTADHSMQAGRIRAMWKSAGYYSTGSEQRLHRVFEGDVKPVSLARSESSAAVPEFDELRPYIAKAVSRVGRFDPVLVVNSDKDAVTEQLDFDRDDVWRILVGGNKLARGFTVEGLTVAYFLRKTKMADAMMQMGRWFGFRRSYADLMRLFLTEELYEAFEAIALDEQYFRKELKRYARPVHGQKQITPKQVPPLVAQRLPWLKPTSANKMYNARLVERRSPGGAVEPGAYPAKKDLRALRVNTEAMLPILDCATELVPMRTEKQSFIAYFGAASHSLVIGSLAQLKWKVPESFLPDLRWLEGLNRDQVPLWHIVLPQRGRDASSVATILGRGPFSLFGRTRRPDRDDHYGFISDPKHRECRPAANADETATPTARMLIYPIPQCDINSVPKGAAIDPEQVVLAFRLELPMTAAPTDGRLITFTTINRQQQKRAIIERTQAEVD
ncbi:Z1 domain-containing protein [Saccharopolyspora erythraea NRRL 2338]|uniref:Endonuclease n=2 Tax=Saccharopolyspora erythraea TaxID=1836 RepID=A4FA09_SACEN|nr:Z1 domain-containing protein [Saccharopolyspora erythraea]EQD85663.1 endonuclease [Saccharopolyspora erythraea D]PFG94669.1 Z1 domain-containing protein [Saccharopolyspora erythraea NRRL 2338]QRK91399.1 Z1 domain-containing protein [Saccharopolyspora erythraea]CAM00884.1 endonuclease [Saccharopolyspora erythraea NRRL 2338]